ncbi:asparagine--tRNA ligase [Geobacter sp. OR-1]|uniref:asparagine--tRNA ligase n=1 Tax=Geobacter sp. OR-1 TaxID=1266765 RepID=UPI000541DF7C|nr:asparagine--tRNA ligase [Geobacter sp. OR-1]GAM10130.1 asparagine--tRNA ligase [Geobacter sp. OR-1]
MTARTRINILLADGCPGGSAAIAGWVRTVRSGKGITFLALNDGSSLECIQVVADTGLENFTVVSRLGTGSAVRVTGMLQESPASGQRLELHATEITVIGSADQDYPLQKKRHSFEFLREIAHLRPRTNTFGAVFRTRSALAQAVHRFFAEKGFMYVHTPIITANDCEGAGELFRVTTLPLDNLPLTNGKVDFNADFFGQATGLTVSGQLEGELFALAFSDIYTFGPTFRAENSNTPRHAAEFWMIEPEMAFADLMADAALAEDFLRYLCSFALEECSNDMAFFDAHIEKGIIGRIRAVADSSFAMMDYSEAISRLEKAPVTFQYPVSWGLDLQTEHERYLTEQVVGGPVFIVNYPKAIKAFYMRQNDDARTVAAMDLLVPKVGEIIGGSQREERLDLLQQRMLETGINPEGLWWYLDSRRWGSCPHAGFGLGFERLVMYITGMENIRDVLPFPRTPRHAGF